MAHGGADHQYQRSGTGARIVSAVSPGGSPIEAEISSADPERIHHELGRGMFLTAPLETINAKAGTGSWNAAHFNNAQYDKLVSQYIAASDLTTQKGIAGQIESLLQAQTPIIFGYFYNYLDSTAKKLPGASPTATCTPFLHHLRTTTYPHFSIRTAQ